ncbi:MAG: ArsC/Spx/MgsR family protein [Vulcanimicrobiota bacterium]
MPEELRLFHNPKCSKSRGCLQILQDRGIEARIVRYLDEVPSRSELEWLWDRLGPAMLRPEAALKNAARAEVVTALLQNPALIERPIVILGDRALVARPPEKVLDLLMERQ